VTQSLIPSQEEIDARERILRSSYFLVRQGSLGEILRCKRCGAKHPYLTLMCVEQPFSGLTGGIFGYCHAGLQTKSYEHLPPLERARFERIATSLGGNLADSHPELVRSMQIAPSDVDSISFALGVLEPITKTKAQQLVWRINAKGRRPPLIVPGIRGGL
jgi:hypothetical protein